MEELTYTVPGISCSHCTQAIETEVGLVRGVDTVSADVESKRVVVRGEALDDRAIRAAIDEAGYEAA
jgi:copper ion binding protein